MTTPFHHHAEAVTRWAGLALGLALAWPGLAQAQYKVVGPDGKVTYTDRPPPASQAKATPLTTAAADTGSGTASLPYELRQVAMRYPVTLYTSAGCSVCDSGRQFLRQRGIPFMERVAGNEDGEALQRATGSRSVPTLTIGSQVLQGWTPDNWASYLDAAGYPKQSALPASYRAPAPTPLVAKAPPAPEPAPAPAPSAPPPAPAPTPGGIRF